MICPTVTLNTYTYTYTYTYIHMGCSMHSIWRSIHTHIHTYRQLQEAEDADEDAELLNAFGRQPEGVAATSSTIHVPSGSCL